MCQHSVQLIAKFRKRNKNSRENSTTTQENQIKGTTHFTDLQESKEWEIKELKENISTLSKRLDNFDSVIDRQEQYSRRNCLLLHGLEEKSNENTDQRVTDVLSQSMGDTIYI